MKNILFLCTGNSCRSQMAEALFNHYKKDTGKAFSAGIEKHGLNPNMLKVLEEINIDTKGLSSKTVEEVEHLNFDYVVTVCSHAKDKCPVYPGSAQKGHRSFDDPPFLTKDMADEEEILSVYRRVRDEIKQYVQDLNLD